MWRAVLAAMLLLALMGCSGDSSEKFLKEGFVSFQQQDYDKAIENYEKAIALGARSPGAFNMLGMAYRYKYQQTNQPGLQENEIISFQKALEVDPKNWAAMVNLGQTYYARGEKAKAAAWLKKALALNPQIPEKAQIEKMIAEEGGGSAPTPPGGSKRTRSSGR